MNTRMPNIEFHGPVATHDQSCAVDFGEPAVYDFSSGTFQPSWGAQRLGWHLIHARSRLQRLALWMLWSKP